MLMFSCAIAKNCYMLDTGTVVSKSAEVYWLLEEYGLLRYSLYLQRAFLVLQEREPYFGMEPC